MNEESSPEQNEELDEHGTAASDADQREASEASPYDRPIEERAAKELDALQTILRKTRRAWRAPVFAEGLVWYVATLGAVAVSGLLFAFLLGEHGPTILRWAVIVGASAATAGALLAFGYFIRSRPSLDDVAALVQRHTPEFRNDVVAALQFARALRAGESEVELGYSPELAFAHVHRTTRALMGAVDGEGSLSDFLPQRNLTPALMAASACLVLLAAPYLIAPQPTSELVRDAMFPPDASEEEDADQRPVVGDIDLYYAYPQYSDLPARFEAYTTGHIETLIGTEVTLKTYPIVQASAFEIVMETSEGSRTVAMEETSGGRLEATILVTRAGTYHFRAKMPDGSIIADGIERTITLNPDKEPEVVLTSHEGELEVSPEDVLDIQFAVNDDFGIEAVSRTYHFAGDEQNATSKPVELPELTHTPSSVDGEIQLDLATLGLQPKDVVIFYVEATDNNSLTGPGIGKSPPLVLRVASPEDKHMKIIADQHAVMEELLGILGDFLEAPVGERVPNAKNVYRQRVSRDLSPNVRGQRFQRIVDVLRDEQTVLGEMAKIVERMEDDPLMLKRDYTLFEALYEQLYALNRDGDELANRFAAAARKDGLSHANIQAVADHASEQEDSLEKGILRLEDLLASQKMSAIQATAEDIRELKDRLRELLEKYRDTRDPELKKAIQREIQRLRQRMAELLSRMQSQIQQLPKDHVNMEAIEQARMESDSRQLGENLERIEDLLEKGDVDAALQALDDMTSNLDSLTEEMDSQFQNAQPDGLSELDKKLSGLMDEVNDLESLQREVEQETNEVQEEIEARERNRIKQMLERETREVRRMVEEQKRQLDQMDERDLPSHDADAVERAQQRIEQLEEMLEQQDIQQSLERARESVDDLRSMEFSMELSQRYTPDDTKRGQEVNESVEDLDEMTPRSRRIVRELEDVMERARARMSKQSHPQLQKLAEQQKAVGEQADELRQQIEDASENFPMLEQQLQPPLENARESMQGAEKGLRQRRTQRSLDHQRSALDELSNLKQSMKDTLQKRRMEQSRGQKQSREKVAIPDEDGRTSHQDFRKGVQKGMKEDRLENYESEIERYYKSLIE